MTETFRIHQDEVGFREYEWGAVRRFMSGTGPGDTVFRSEGTLETGGLSLGEGWVGPGQGKISPIHPHEEEAYLFTQGAGVVTVGNSKFEVEPGSVVYLPAGISHAMKSVGDDPLTYIFAVGFPRPGSDTVAAGGRTIHEQDVAIREYEWGWARRYMSVSGAGWERYLSDGTIVTAGLSIGRGQIAPHSRKPASAHEDEEEAYLFLCGAGSCLVAGQEVSVQAGSVVYIPAGAEHGTTNHGEQPLEYIFALGFLRPI